MPRRHLVLALLAPALAAPAVAAVPAAAGEARSALVVRGAGFGHGVGMSQYGAYGQALEGRSYREILRHYYRGTAIGTVDPGRPVRVLLQSGVGTAWFSGATRAGGRALRGDRRYGARSAAGGRVALLSPTGRVLERSSAPLRVTGPQPIVLHGRAGNGRTDGAYRGALEFRPGGAGGMDAVNAVPLDDYLLGVVPDESPPSWPDEALKAQAVAARSYAITTSKNGAGFDHYPDTRSQVYGGVAAEHPRSTAAVRATAGEVVSHGGAPVVTYFFSTSGGRTEDVESGFPGADPKPWLRSVSDPHDRVSPRHRWGPFRLTLGQAGAKLGGLVAGAFRGIEVVDRGSSPRIVSADVVGTRGRTRVSGAALRARFRLWDTWASFVTISSRPGGPPSETALPRPEPQSGPTGGVQGPAGDESQTERRAPATVRGFVHPARGRVRVQRRTPAGWRTVSSVRVARSGRYSAPVPATGVYRAVHAGETGPAVRVR